jgi:iron complex transport system permease protein
MTDNKASGERSPSAAQHRGRELTIVIAVALLVAAAAAFLQITLGAYDMTWHKAWAALTDPAVWQPAVIVRLLGGEGAARALHLPEAPALATSTLIVWNVRLPRILVGLMVGANLAISGTIFQAITRNELASPYLLGVSSGAGLAVLLGLMVYPVLGAHLPLVAMLGGSAAFLAVYAIAWHHGTSPVRLVLAGVIIGAIAGSLQTMLFFLAKDLSTVQNAMSWTVGSLTGAGWEQVRMIAPWTLASVVLGLSATRYLDVLLLGDPTATALGMNVERVRFLLAATAILAASSAVAVSGLIGFVGLIVPHIVRTSVGSAHRRVIVGCLFAGPALLTAADVLARLAFAPVQVPVGIVTGVLGGGFFLYLMRRRREFGKL